MSYRHNFSSYVYFSFYKRDLYLGFFGGGKKHVAHIIAFCHKINCKDVLDHSQEGETTTYSGINTVTL